MLALLSRFLGVLISRVEDEKEDEELVLARESSSDIPILWATAGAHGKEGRERSARGRHDMEIRRKQTVVWRYKHELWPQRIHPLGTKSTNTSTCSYLGGVHGQCRSDRSVIVMLDNISLNN